MLDIYLVLIAFVNRLRVKVSCYNLVLILGDNMIGLLM